MIHDFKQRIITGDFQHSEDDMMVLKRLFDADRVVRASRADDINGIDYYVILRSGVKISVDVKHMSSNKYWEDPNEPELSLETWSIVEGSYAVWTPTTNWVQQPKKKIGWTEDESKLCHYIFYKFDKHPALFILPFQLLRLVFKEKKAEWIAQYPHKYTTQRTMTPRDGVERKIRTTKWDSKCLFMQAEIVLHEVYLKMMASRKAIVAKEKTTLTKDHFAQLRAAVA